MVFSGPPAEGELLALVQGFHRFEGFGVLGKKGIAAFNSQMNLRQEKLLATKERGRVQLAPANDEKDAFPEGLEGVLEGAHELIDSPVTIAAVYGMAQAIEGFHLARTGQPVEWPLIAAALRDNVRMIAERREELENPDI